MRRAIFVKASPRARPPSVACQRDGTTALSETRDHLGVLASIVGRRFVVNGGAPMGASLAVGRAFDDEGVRA
jgi:hypothetical protein